MSSLLVVALLLSLVNVMSPSSQQSASSYIPDTFPTYAANSPTVTVAVTHSPTSPQPKQGDTYTYNASFTLGNMTEAGSTNQVVVTVYADPNAPWTTTPVATDFTSAFGTPTLTNCSTTSCTATWPNVQAAGVISFTHAAKVVTPLPDGTPIVGSATASVNTTPSVALTNVSQTAFPGQCSGTYTFDQKVGASGAWLVDMKFADVAGDGKVILTPDGATQIRAWNDPAAEGDTIKIISGADGSDITAAVMANATYVSNDPSSPYYIGLDPTNQTKFANATWLDALNWRYDPDTWTGNTWLPAGTTIQVKREVTYLGCLPGGIVGDGTATREFGISTEIARASTTVSDSAFDLFSMPGVRAKTTCESGIFVNSATNTATTTSFLRWIPNTSTTSLGTSNNFRADASAATADHPEWIFYASQAGVLKVWDTSLATPANVAGTGTANPPSGVTWTTSFNALAFAPDGTLWAAAGNSLFYLTAADVTSFLAGGTVTWKTGTAFLRRSTMSTGYYAIGDIAFDGNGNLWFVGTHSGETTGQGDVGMLLSTELKMGNTTAYSVTKWAKIATGYGNNLLPRGLAFLGNKLYMGVGSTNTTDELREIYWTSMWNGTTWNGTPTSVMSADLSNTSTNNVPVPSDFASCSFPKATDVSGPAFKVQKSVVNPDGTVAPAGGTSPQSVAINADGTFTVNYLITVTAIGTTSGTPNSITDTLTVPAGFSVTGTTLAQLGGTPAAVTSPFTISAGTIGTLDPLGSAGPISKTYEVTVSLKLNNPTAANWTSIGTCNTTGSGTPGTGVFNAVTMTGDADTTDNDACITAASARLNLAKQIVTANGTQVTGSTDSQYFDLIAGGPTGFVDKSLTSGDVGTPTYVVPGTYRLGEQGNDGGTTSGLYQLYATWSCIDLANANTAVAVTNGAIVVKANMNVQCVIKNTKTPKVHIVKTATTPVAGNSHIGTTITPNPDGTFIATYTITVTNTSGFTTNTGAITDGFLVPAGLLWDGTKTATVTYNANGTGATASGLVASVTRAQLATWATLATSVQSLPNNAAVTFTIAIPLKLDLSVPSGSTTTVYASNATSLGQCQSMSSSSGGPYTTMTAGIPNMTALVDEDLTYSTIAIEDNIACVPVVASTTWKVEKHPEGDANDGANDGLGPTTTATYDAVTNTFSATVKYFVTVTNSGNFPGTNPAVTDTVTLAPGFAITALSVQGVDQTFTAGSSTATFTIPAGTTALAGGQSVTYTVIVTGRGNPTPTQWTQAGTCNVSGAGTAGSGFFNQVTLTGDTDGVNNNDACVPVVEPTRVITVQKYASTCDVNVPTCSLGGAQFDVYSVDPRTLGAVPITQGIGPDAVPPTGYAPGSTFTSTSLHYGVDYWLVERNAPTGYSLLADPIKFRLTDTGIVLPPDPADATVNNTGTVRIVGNQFTVTIIDPQQGRLPVSGGAGPLPFLAIGLLIALGASWHLRKVSVQVAPRRAL